MPGATIFRLPQHHIARHDTLRFLRTFTLAHVFLPRRVVAAAVPAAVLFATACQDGTGASGTPAAIRKVAGDSLASSVGIAVSTLPTVRVTTSDGSPVRNARVTFVPADTASGSVAGPAVLTDADGRAAPVGWNLGRRAIAQRLVAKVEGLGDSVVFVARAQASGALTVEAASPLTLTGTVLQLPSTLPAVRLRDVFGNPVAGQPVLFIVDTVGPIGRLAGTINNLRFANILTDSQGVARAPWVLGRRAISQTLGARYGDFGQTILFTASAAPAVPSLLAVAPAQTTDLSPNTTYSGFPRFTVVDAFDNPVPNVPVRFTLTDAGGSLGQAVDTTDGSGAVDPGSYRTGPDTGTKRIQAAVIADTNVQATAVLRSRTGVVGQFTITVRYITTPTPEVQAAFTAAANRWAQIITGDLQDLTLASALTCNGNSLPAGTVIDDIVIDAAIVPIDGVGSILGSAGPCSVRPDAAALPLYGTMRFDEADMANLQASGRLGDVILHEMGHVLGIGTLWASRGLLPNPVPSPCNNASADPRYVGAQAIARYRAAGGTDAQIAVENTNGCGTANGHWRETFFSRELMTGFINNGVTNPISGMTIGSLADLGYVVSFVTAEPCTGFAPCVRADAAPTGGEVLFQLHEVPLAEPPRRVAKDRLGRVYDPLK